MGQPRRSRFAYGVAVVIVIALGLASRKFTSNLPAFVGDYAGDTLWALMVFMLLAFIWPSASSARLAAAAIAFAFAIELTQLYHAPGIDRVRDTRLGALSLGSDFVWSDLLCYATGVAMGMGFDRVFPNVIATTARTVAILAIVSTLVLTNCSRSTNPDGVGLLFTVAERGDVHDGPDRFVTRWIEYDGVRAQEVHRIDGLVVPRSDGFWRVGVTRECPDPEPDDTRVHCADAIWTEIASAATPDVKQDTLSDACTTEYLRIDFASPEMLAVYSRYWQSDCSARGFSDVNKSVVRRYESEEPVAFAGLGAGAAEAYRAAAVAARNYGALDGPPGTQGESCRASTDESTGWRIHRDRDHWAASLYQQHYSELCMLEAPIDWKLPTGVIGSADAPADWPAIAKALPQAEQAFASPDGKLAVILLPDVIRVYSLVRGVPTTQLLEYPRKDIVMVQWAVSPVLGQWTQALAAIQ